MQIVRPSAPNLQRYGLEGLSSGRQLLIDLTAGIDNELAGSRQGTPIEAVRKRERVLAGVYQAEVGDSRGVRFPQNLLLRGIPQVKQ